MTRQADNEWVNSGMPTEQRTDPLGPWSREVATPKKHDTERSTSALLVPASLAIAAVVVLVLPAATYMARAANGGSDGSDYAALRTAVLDGKDIRMVLDLSACTAQQSGKPGPAMSGSLHFDAYMLQGDGTIAFAMTHFTLRSDKTPVYEFLAFRVHPSSEVDARTSFLNVPTFAVIQESAFSCSIGRAVTFHW
jgi:hypothetical protein